MGSLCNQQTRTEIMSANKQKFTSYGGPITMVTKDLSHLIILKRPFLFIVGFVSQCLRYTVYSRYTQ